MVNDKKAFFLAIHNQLTNIEQFISELADR